MAALHAPPDLLTGYGAAGPRVAHFTGQIAEVAKIYVHVYGHCGGGSLMQITVGKMLMARTLLETGIKRSPGKDHAFLIAF
jgi:hypothetical protein